MDVPVSVGDVLELPVFAFGSNGDALVRKEGYNIFVTGLTAEFARIGQVVKIRIKRTKDKFAFSEIVQ